MDPLDVMNSNVIFVERDTPVSDTSDQLVWVEPASGTIIAALDDE